MPTWPSGNKAVTTTTDGATDKISDARTDINKTIANVNDIIDIFNIPSSPTDNHILKYNASTGVFDVEADAEGNSTLGLHNIWIPAQAMYPTADGGSSNITTSEVTEGAPELRTLDFDKDTTEFAQFSIAMPKSWNESTITFTAYWTAASGSGGCSWGLQGVAVSDDDPIASTFGTAVVVDDTYNGTANDLHITSVSGDLTIAGTPVAGDLCFFQVFRDHDDSNDTLTTDAKLIGIKINYITESGTDA